MDRGINVNIAFDRLVELVRIYKELIMGFTPQDDHDELLFVHMKAFHHRLRLMAVREQAKYRVNLDETESVAFRQTWERGHVIPGWTEWSQVIIDAIMNLISKQFHQLKTRSLSL